MSEDGQMPVPPPEPAATGSEGASEPEAAEQAPAPVEGEAKEAAGQAESSPSEGEAAPASPETSVTSAKTSGSPGGHHHHHSKRKKGDLDLEKARIGFLGAGKMTETIVDGLLKSGLIPARHIFVSAPSKKNLERFKLMGCHASTRGYDLFSKYECDVVFICFHGSVIQNCYKQGGTRPNALLTNYIPKPKRPLYVLSLVSGVTLAQIKSVLLNPEHKDGYIIEMHRIMMNTAVAFGLGICGIDCEPDSKKLTPPIRTLLSSLAKLEYVPESQMDAACAIAGSGLAFAYYFISALADGGLKCGLPKPLALKFAAKTALSAAQCLIANPNKHPAEFRDEVTAPSGAAIYGIHVLDRAEVASGVAAAIEAAHRRAQELSQAD